MANQIIAKYLADPSISVEKRKKIAEGLNSKQLSEAAALKGITSTYGNKYGSPETAGDKNLGGDLAKKALGALNPSNLGKMPQAAGEFLANKAPEIGGALSNFGKNLPDMTPEQKAKIEADKAATTAIQDKRSENVGYLNSKGIVPEAELNDDETPEQSNARIQQTTDATRMVNDTSEFMRNPVGSVVGNVAGNVFDAAKGGLLKGAEGVQKVGAAISGNTDSLEGFRQFYGLKKPEEVQSGDVRKLEADERGQEFGEGLLDFTGGILEGVFSPSTGAIKTIPGGEQAMQFVNEKAIMPVVQTASGTLKNTLKGVGVQLSPEQEAAIDEGMGTLASLLMVKVGEDFTKGRTSQLAKDNLTKSIPEMIKKGDFEGARTALTQYESMLKPSKTTPVKFGDQTKPTKPIAPKKDGIIKTAIEGGQSKMSGLDVETIRTLKNMPDEFKKVAANSIDDMRSEAFNQIKNSVDDKMVDLSSSGKTYQSFQGGQIKIDNFLKDKIQQAGLTIDDTGKIRATAESSVRSAAEINKMQSLADMYLGKKTPTGKEFLNLRSDLAELAKYNQETTPGLRLWAKNTRAQLNKYRDQAPGLKELDASNAKLRTELKGVKNLIYDKAGNVKPDAISKVNNLFNKGKEGHLEAIKKVVPDFEKFKNQVRLTKALEDVERATSVKVGTYAQNFFAAGGGGIAGASLAGAAGGPIGAVVGLLLSNPQIFTKLLIEYSKVKNFSSGALKNISKSIKIGKPLTAQQSQIVADMITHFSEQGAIVASLEDSEE